MFKLIKKCIRISLISICILFTITLSSCLSKYKKENIYTDENGFRVYDLGLFKNSKIIVPENQSKAQSLSIVVKDKDGSLLVFDGGRNEDADYLTKIIKDNGGKVKAWFLTHIHDDHIGALYTILTKKEYDIEIKNLYYKFADFDWYYGKIGNDAGALVVFENAIDDYNNSIPENNRLKYEINVNKNVCKGEIYEFSNTSVEVINSIFLLDSDPINNSSIVYRTKIEDKYMLIYGDMGYAGGEKLIAETWPTKLNADIIVLSHHGQNGVDDLVYYYANPKVAIWPTTKAIYENKEGKYDTNKTKQCIDNIGVKYNILSYEGTSILK